MSSKRYSYEKTGLVRAQAKHVRSSARKARLVLEHIRGKSVLEARAILLYSKRDVAKDIELVLRSAVHNAETNHGLDADGLVIEAAFADESLTMKRWQPRARGRASRIRKRTSHITILLRATGAAAVPVTEEQVQELAARPKRVQNPSRKERAAAKTDAPAEPEATEVEAPAAEAEEVAAEASAVEETAAPEASADETEAADDAADEPKKDEG